MRKLTVLFFVALAFGGLWGCDDESVVTPPEDLELPNDGYDFDDLINDNAYGETDTISDTPDQDQDQVDQDTDVDTDTELPSCTGVVCEEWESCRDGQCYLNPGRCETNSDCTGGEVCDRVAHTCVSDPCAAVDCGNGGVCSVDANTNPVCNCPFGFMPEGTSCVADTAPEIHWCNIQWPLSIAGSVGDPAVTVYSQLYVDSDPTFNTPFSAVPAGLKAQLGQSGVAVGYPVIATDIQWVDASFNPACTTCGNNNEFSAPFSMDQGGTRYYLFRYSLNDGQSWTYCGFDGVIKGTPNVGVAQIEGGSTQCGGVTCEDWQQCVSDACRPAAGRCGANSDCGSGQTCNLATHTCQGSGDGPLLTLVAQPTISATGYSLQVRYTGNNPIDLAQSRITLNGELVDLNSSYDDQTGIFDISATGLANGKYTYLFRVVDSAGQRSNDLYLPMWLESSKFEWRDMFLYQVMTDRFLDGKGSNNAPVTGVDSAANWQGGDFAGIIAKLEDGYFEQMGVNAIWISSPILNTDGAGRGLNDYNRYFSGYHSYWPIATGWTDRNPLPGITSPIDPHFGTEAELHELVQLAHSKGIRILVDFVANHVYGITNANDAYGSTAPLWDDRPNDDWFHSPGNPYICGWDQPIVCWFTNYLPDLNYSNQQVMQLVVDHAIWMAQEFDFDGFRLDAVKHMVMDFTTTTRSRIRQDLEVTGVPFYTVGETFDGGTYMLGLYVGDDKLTGQFEFGFYYAIKDNVLGGTNLSSVKATTDERDTYYQTQVWNGALMPYFIGNHDVTRAFNESGNDAGKMRAAFTILLTSPPPPLVYQGDEICEPGGADPDNRHMMRFSGLQGYETETKNWVAKLGRFRQQHKALRGGARSTCEVSNDRWSYKMTRDGETVLVGVNRSGSGMSLGCGLSGSYVDQDGNTGTLPATVPAYGNLVLSVN
ncbi:MAG: alpha-amylase family glycosyl hydrolase [Myxococcota bacterium]|jgi:glycosidase|nr:alpha-amylase family glycosyl hydrolase [Myxococcota bacterium]